METLLNVLLMFDIKMVKNELFLSKSDFLECKKTLNDVRISEFIGLPGIPGIKKHTIFIQENEIRFIFNGDLTILTEDKSNNTQDIGHFIKIAEEKEDLLQKKENLYKMDEIKPLILDGDGTEWLLN